MAAKTLKQQILEILEGDARTPASTIAVMLGARESDVRAAIEEMEKDGTIVKYAAIVDPSKLDATTVEAYIELRVNPSQTHGFEGIAKEIARFDEVKSLFLMSGGYDFAVVVEGRNLREVAMFVSEKLSTLDKIVTTATHFILKRYKSNGILLQKGDSTGRLAVHA